MKKIYFHFNLFLSSKDKTKKLSSSVKQGLFALAFTVFSGAVYSQATYTLNYTGGQQTVGLTPGTYSIQCWGANGGDNLQAGTGGKGGFSTGSLSITSPTTLYINVGGKGLVGLGGSGSAAGGYNGGGTSGAYTGSGYAMGSGGGASHVASATGVLSSLSSNQSAVRIVAGGGGGSGSNNGPTTLLNLGGNGGGLTGANGLTGTYGGTGGTQTAGGTGAIQNGAFGQGGNNSGSNTGGGGGGGWYGGGAAQWEGSGGGSGYIGGVTTAITAGFGQTGFVANPVTTGNGLVIIKELCSISLFASGNNSLNPSICSGQSLTLTTTAVSNYTWSNNVTNTTSIVVAPTSTQLYSVVGTSTANCQSVAFITVTVSAAVPVLSIANPSNNICLGKTVSLTATGALTYTWVNPGVVNGQTFTPNATAVYTVNGQNGCGITTGTTTIVVAPLPVSVLATPSLVCEGYPSTLTAVASVPNYTWMPGSVPGGSIVVSPGSTTLYTVTATDGTCSGTQTLLLTTKTTPTITAASTSSNICEGDQVTLTANGAGTGGSYSWTPGGTGASINQAPPTTTLFAVAGTNAVGCTAYAQQIVIVQAAPPMTVTAVANKTMICSGQTTTLNVTGAPLYSWVNGPSQTPNAVSPTAVTVYTALGTHQTNTCVATRTIEVSVITPSVILTPSATICAGQQAVLNASGATSYTWNGLVIPSGTYSTSPAATTTYTLLTSTKVGAVSCPKSYTAMVTVNQLPTLTVTATRATVCKGETNTLTITGATSYSLGTTPATSNVVTITPTSLQNYVITGLDVNGCQNTLTYIAKVSGCVGLNESSLDMVLSVYPNPSSGEFILSTEKDINVELFNELGQHLRSITLNETNNHEVKINDLAPGIYFIKAQNNDFKISQKIVITK